MLPLKIVTTASTIIQKDSILLSYDEKVPFWHQDGCVLNESWRLAFDKFLQVKVIDVYRIVMLRDRESIDYAFDAYDKTVTELRRVLSLNPDKTAHSELIFTAQLAFMLIVSRAIAHYQGGSFFNQKKRCLL